MSHDLNNIITNNSMPTQRVQTKAKQCTLSQTRLFCIGCTEAHIQVTRSIPCITWRHLLNENVSTLSCNVTKYS